MEGEGYALVDGAGSGDFGGGSPGKTTAVIGRQADTAVALDWPGHDVLNMPDDEWSLAANDAWVQGHIAAGDPFYLASPLTAENLWDIQNSRPTVYGREVSQILNAGYIQVGNELVPGS